jgi:hypothetical protein
MKAPMNRPIRCEVCQRKLNRDNAKTVSNVCDYCLAEFFKEDDQENQFTLRIYDEEN